MTIKKQISIIFSLLLGAAPMTTQPSASAQTPADGLIGRLRQTVNQGKYFFGHHDDPVYGHTWKYEAGRSDVKEVTRRYPGLMNWDLGLIEWGCEKELDGVPFDLIREEIRKQDARGGINALSWHVRNPLTRGDSWDVKGITADPATRPLTQSLKEGAALNDTLRLWIGRAADFIGSLRREDGSRIAVVFRPWHEHTGGWFWWGADHSTPEDYKALWKLTREVFDRKGIDNVVWAYSPDVVKSTAHYQERFPGADLVDVCGADVYHRNGEAGLQDYRNNLRTTLSAAEATAKQYGKILAFSETGSETLPMARWWTEVLTPAVAAYPIAYLCVWRNAHDNPTHFYAPFKGQASARDFKSYSKSKRVIMVK